LSRDARRLLMAAPLLYGLAWGALWLWAQAGAHAFGGEARLHETDISSSRFGIWANTLALIARQPWSGVGFGEFNLAWSMTPFPGRPTAFFDHAHNLPLHLAGGTGNAAGGAGARPAAAGRLARIPRRARCECRDAAQRGDVRADDRPAQPARVPAVVRLLPAAAAWVWSFALGGNGPGALRARPLLAGGMLVVSLAAVADYQRVVRIFEAPADGAAAGAAHPRWPRQLALRPPRRLRRGHHRRATARRHGRAWTAPSTTCWTPG
jgi:hypothetical protein